MLSSEKYPTDPSCPSDDERPYDRLKAVDLSTSDLEKGPKFSIRDYVFVTRNKDFANNWPFSQNNLQLCVKHGVKDLLPPFQSSGLVRNPPHVKCNVESALVDKENRCNSSGKPFDLSNHFELVKSNKSGSDLNLFVDSSSINPSVSEADKELGSTTTTISSCNSHFLPTDKSSSLDFEAKTLKKPSEVSEVVIRTASQNRETTNQSSVKKCRLILKYSNIPRSSTKEASTVNAPMSSEAMAVCPVCRTFSSSSNTTLNAHIDQCLSGEYTTKSVADSKVDRHRIKPRKTRLMVDIYKTALHYTLEELDRRNGSNWASNRTFSAPEVEICADQQGLCLDVKETTGDGSVYVDSNGTKLRILSKFGNPATDSETVYTPLPRKLLKEGKGSMGLLAKKIKVKSQIQKQQKCLRQATHGKKIPSSRLHCSPEISNGQDGVILREEVDDEDECSMEQHKSSDQVKLSKTETTKGWVRSKKTDLMKKTNSMDDKWHSRECTDGNLLAKRGLSSLTSLHVKKLGDLKFPNAISPGKSGRNDNSSHKVHDESRGDPSLRKRMGSSVESEFCHGRKRSLVSCELSEHGLNDIRKNGSPDHRETAPSPDKRRVEIRESRVRNADNSVANPKLSSSHHASTTRKFSSLRKKFSSASHASAPDSKFSPKRKFSAVKKSKVFSASKSDEEEALSHSGMDQSQDFLHEISEEHSRWGDSSSEESFDTSVVLKVRSSGESMISKEEEAIALKSSQSTSMHSHHEPDAWNENVSLMSDSVARHTSESIYSSRTDNMEQLSELPVGGQFMRFSNSVEPGFLGLPGLTGGAQCNSQKFMDGCKLPLYEAEVALNSTEPVLTLGQDILGANLIPENTRIGNVCVMVGLDCSGGEGNYLAEVDQIPIPGPPGSYLPSPRHMGSDELQGNSTLTSSRVQSLDDRQEFADQSSESPASVTSTVSNSNIPISGSQLLRFLSVGPPAKDLEIFGSTIAANNDVETCPPKTKLNNAWTERPSLNDCMTNVTVSDNRPFGCRNDHPCCGSRKEGLLQNVALNYHDSPLLQRRTMGSILGSSCGTQMSCGVNGTWDNQKSSTNLSRPVQGDDGTKLVAGLVSSSVYNDNEVHFRATADRESVGPAPSTPVLRLMGKNLMVINNKDENMQPDLKHSMSNSMIGHANLQEVSGVYTGNVHNEECHRLPHMNSQDPCFFQRDGRLSKGLRNYEHSYTPQATSVTTVAMLMDQSAARDFTGSLMHHEYTGGHGLPTQRIPINSIGNLPTYNRDKVVVYPSLLYRATDYIAKADKDIIVIDDNAENENGPTASASHTQLMGVTRDGAVCSAGMSNSLSLCSDYLRRASPCETQQYVYGRPVRSLVDSSVLVPPPNGANSELVKWNCTLGTSDVLHASLNTGSSPGARFRSEILRVCRNQ